MLVFTKELSRGRLPLHEKTKQTARGEEVITKLHAMTEGMFTASDAVEVDMKNEGVLLGEAHIIGKLDLLHVHDNSYEVTDFKTGKAFASWDSAKTDTDKIKLHMYLYSLDLEIVLEPMDHSWNTLLNKSCKQVNQSQL